MKKRILKTLIPVTMGVCFLFTAKTTAMASEKEITIYINGTEISFSEQPPLIVEGRTLVPASAIFDALGVEDSSWNPNTKTYTVNYDNETILIQVGSSRIVREGAPAVVADVPAQIINGRTMIPLRALSECLGIETLWHNDTRTITIDKDSVV